VADFTTLLVEDRGPVRVITIDRPKALNALNSAVVLDLSHALEAVATSPEIRGVVITGSGEKAFVAGADISEMAEMDEAAAGEFASRGHGVGEMIAHLSVPVVAAVNGFALGGGCELALACDWIYASEHAKFGQPEVKLGVTPGFGGTQRLARRIGAAKAMEWCMTGEMFDAKQAYELGLVNRVCARGEVLQAAVDVLTLIASRGPLAIAAVKRVIHEGVELPLHAANQLEIDAFARLFASADQKEGMRAFLAKREPAFSGR
jgi:enoyl-CoA hydratase